MYHITTFSLSFHVNAGSDKVGDRAIVDRRTLFYRREKKRSNEKKALRTNVKQIKQQGNDQYAQPPPLVLSKTLVFAGFT